MAQFRKRLVFLGLFGLLAVAVAFAIPWKRDELSIKFLRYQGNYAVIELTNATTYHFSYHPHVRDEIYSDGVLLTNEATVERVWIGNATNPNVSILIERWRVEGDGALSSLRRALRFTGSAKRPESWFLSAPLPPRDPPHKCPTASAIIPGMSMVRVKSHKVGDMIPVRSAKAFRSPNPLKETIVTDRRAADRRTWNR
jgi:hypothetical protein